MDVYIRLLLYFGNINHFIKIIKFKLDTIRENTGPNGSLKVNESQQSYIHNFVEENESFLPVGTNLLFRKLVGRIVYVFFA